MRWWLTVGEVIIAVEPERHKEIHTHSFLYHFLGLIADVYTIDVYKDCILRNFDNDGLKLSTHVYFKVLNNSMQSKCSNSKTKFCMISPLVNSITFNEFAFTPLYVWLCTTT